MLAVLLTVFSPLSFSAYLVFRILNKYALPRTHPRALSPPRTLALARASLAQFQKNTPLFRGVQFVFSSDSAEAVGGDDDFAVLDGGGDGKVNPL